MKKAMIITEQPMSDDDKNISCSIHGIEKIENFIKGEINIK